MYIYIYIQTTGCASTMTDGCLEVKLPTVWTDEGAGMGRVREEKGRRKKIREEKESKKENESA